MTGNTLWTALLTKVKNVGVNELTSGASGATSIGSNMFVVRGFGCGIYACIRISSSYCDVLTRLAVVETGVCASETTWGAFSTCIVVYCFFVKVYQTILNAFITFQK